MLMGVQIEPLLVVPGFRAHMELPSASAFNRFALKRFALRVHFWILFCSSKTDVKSGCFVKGFYTSFGFLKLGTPGYTVEYTNGLILPGWWQLCFCSIWVPYSDARTGHYRSSILERLIVLVPSCLVDGHDLQKCHQANRESVTILGLFRSYSEPTLDPGYWRFILTSNGHKKAAYSEPAFC